MKIRAVFAACALALALPAQAAKWEIFATMDGLQEVPANETTATGNVSGLYDDVSNSFAWLVNFSGLLGGAASGGHFHQAAVGSNGPIQINFTDQVSGKFSGSANGISVLSDAQEVALLNNGFYANIHTPEFPGGEIRGQLAASLVPEPAAWLTMAMGLLALGFAGRRQRRG
jgi:hypothetical protein